MAAQSAAQPTGFKLKLKLPGPEAGAALTHQPSIAHSAEVKHTPQPASVLAASDHSPASPLSASTLSASPAVAALPAGDLKPVVAAPQPTTPSAPHPPPTQQSQPISVTRVRPQANQVIDVRNPVSAAHYNSLKRKYLAAQETADQASLALHRAQQLITRLRNHNAALLNHLHPSSTPQSLPLHPSSSSLLHPPPLPSVSDRPRARPKLDTATDFTTSAYDAPLGEALPPSHLPPRLRSPHFLAVLAMDRDRKREGVVGRDEMEGESTAGKAGQE